ncbi:histidine kinase [Aequorivita todarodis]|uniref:sensor histidine kinase n=1 Tax=Aequorivita todarodis TaxID=2036821 RepID=UPI002350BDFA|nr:histidine kinase [Aequorivita todarodis]MDC8001466.1 histidine kinase [Aequorivita todarodis]
MLTKLTIITFLSSWVITFAQETLHFTTKHGLPTNHIYDIAEDADGFMWFATKQGLVKYDGETFKIFTIKDGLPNNDTWLLEPDLKGRLWFFSKSQRQGYIKNDSIHTFATKQNEVISPRFIYKSKDSLWFNGTSGVQTFNKDNIVDAGFLNHSNLDSINMNLLEIQKKYGYNSKLSMPIFVNPETNDILFFQKDKLLVYDWNLSFKKEITVNIPLEFENKMIENQGLLYNQIGYFAMGKGVLFIDFKTYHTIYKSFKELVNVEEVKYFRCTSQKDKIQVSIPGKLIIFDNELNLKETHSFPMDMSKLSFKDNNGNLWIADLSNGLSMIPKNIQQTKYYLKNKKIQKINIMDSILYAGANDDGFFQYVVSEDNFKKINHFTKQNAEIYQIKKNRANHIKYFISAGNSFIIEQSLLKPLHYEKLKSTGDKVAGIKDIATVNGFNYIVTNSAIILNKNMDEPSEFIVFKNGLLFAEIFKNQLYTAGSDGLHKIVGDKIVTFKSQDPLLNVSVSTLMPDNDYLFVGTDGRGVYLYNDSEKIFHLKETDGLSIQRIIKKENVLWLATQKGVKKIALDQKNIESSKIIDAFYTADGLWQDNTNDIFIKDSLLYAASDDGLAVLNINSKSYQKKPKLYFNSQNDTLFFKNGERDQITISFSTLDYVNQKQIAYQYRLLPIQKEWVSTTTKTLNFSNLSPKLYTLEVKATDQHFNETISKQYLHVIPAWYQTLIAKIGFGLLALFCLWLFFKILKTRIRKKEETKAQHEKKLAGLELQALRSQMNPHFVHNSLNAIQYFIQRNEVELSENYLSKFSQLIRLFFEYSRLQTVTIKEELSLLKNYLEIEKLRFEEKLNFNIVVSEKIDVEEQAIPSMLLQPIVENAVNHGLFHKKESGTVTIKFIFINDTTYQVLVEDDGIGVIKAKKLFNTSSKNYRSNSSLVLQERIELLNQSTNWNIEYSIKDCSEIDIEKTGTCVTLTFNQSL